jgi:putative redox protein
MAKSVHATFVDLEAGMRVEAHSGSGFNLAFDATDGDTPGTAASPREGLLAALGACTAMDVASILRKKRQPPTAYEVSVVGDTQEDVHPHVFTRIVVEHRVEGDVQPEALRRSVELSATRYCPVSAMLSAAVEIEHRYRLRRPGDGEDLSELVLITGPNPG